MEQAAAILTEMRVPFVINQNSYSIFNRTIENTGLKQAWGIFVGLRIVRMSSMV